MIRPLTALIVAAALLAMLAGGPAGCSSLTPNSSDRSANAGPRTQPPPAVESASTPPPAAAGELCPIHDLDDDSIMPADQLRPGMKGFGLTVFRGARPERFDVEILSVLSNYEPQTDMILIRCSGHDLEKTGIAAGMSGSPIYVNNKLIGALAFGWSFNLQPIAGVQPIKQMMRNSGLKAALPPASQQDLPEGTGQGGSSSTVEAACLANFLNRNASGEPRSAALAGAGGGTGGLSASVLAGGQSGQAGDLRPLAIPLMVSGGSAWGMDYLRRQLAGTGLVPLRSGGGGGANDPRMKDARIEPGGTVTIPLLRGDMDASALGTVTAVAGEKVLAFGHPMFGEGPVNLPMATGIVHTFIPSIESAFKMGSAGEVVGAIRRDESTAICGVTGPAQRPAMTPMTVKVNSWDGSPQKVYHYQVADEWFYGPRMAGLAAMSSLTADHGMPINLTVYYTGTVKFRGFEPYTFSGVGSGLDGAANLADRLETPINAMLNNAWGKALVESIDIEARSVNENRTASLERTRLEESVLLPGEPAVIDVHLKRYRKPPLDTTFTIDLPAGLADGSYELSMVDADGYRRLMARHDPRSFTPRNMTELLAGFDKLVKPRDDHFYFVLTLPKGGLAGRDQRLPSLPPSRAMILGQANRERFQPYTDDQVWAFPMGDLVVSGSEEFSITIDRNKAKKK